ncbi:MAG TPA: HYR domain-containing protein [Pyrinomonadaceae bacterium]|nr:HYR domain-containing protein [Pyrinomonadaceae bacterium]
MAALSHSALLAAPVQFGPEDIAAYEDDCTTPKTSFEAGDVVCAKVSGLLLGPRRIYWISPNGGIVQTDAISQTSLTATRTVSVRGEWGLYLASEEDGSLRTSSFFSVRDPGNLSAELAVVNLIDRRVSSFAAGGSIRYLVAVANRGPDAATNVSLTGQAPNDSTFDESSQESGPAFTCALSGEMPCTIASLAPGDIAVFSFVYNVNSGVPTGTEISYTVDVDSDTEELHEGNNSSTAVAAITGEVTEETCALECPNDITVTADTEQNGVRGAFVTFGAAEGFGDCGALTASHTSGSFFPAGQSFVTFSSEQGGGGCTITINVVDAPAPGITCPPDKSATADPGELEASVEVGTPATTGTVLSVVGVRSDGLTRSLSDPYSVGTTTITWTARDKAADPQTGLFPPDTRSATCQQRVVVTSNDAPTITCPADKTFDAPEGHCEMTLSAAQIGTPVTTGNNVEVVAVRSDRLPLTSPFPANDTEITWTATDAAGRVTSCTQTITVKASAGNAPPVLNVPPDVEVLTNSCTALVDDELGVATATGACGTRVRITRTGIPTRTFLNRQIPTFIFPVGTTVITYTATDSAGNSTTGTQRVVVKERSVTPPTVNAPDDIVVNTGAGAASCGVVVSDSALGSATATDNCPGVTVSRSGVPAGNFFPVGDTYVTYTATDASGYTATDVQKVTVVDDTPPTIAAPADVTLYTGAGATSCGLTVANLDAALGTATANDNCPGVQVARSGVPAGSFFPLGETTVTYTATDARGNKASATQKVTVVDNTPPVITPPPDITVYLPLNSTATSMPVTYPVAATATDNCPGTVSIGYSHASGSVFSVGPTVVTITATDVHNNPATATFTVTVLYNFTGFFSPVENGSVFNLVKAGQSVPMKFSLSGNKGPDILAADSPTSAAIACPGNPAINDVSEVYTLTAGSSGLTYDALSDQYKYVWKTESSWVGACRQFNLKLNDGSVHKAYFKFK